MRCPFCAGEDTRVIDTRLHDGGDSVRRRRQCQTCAERFTTYEQLIFNIPQVIKSDGRREPFNEDKLRRGMMRALEKRPIDSEQIESAINRILRRFTHKDESELPVQAISESVIAELRDLDEVAYVRFASVYRSFQDLDAFDQEVRNLRRTPQQQIRKVQLSVFTHKKTKNDPQPLN